MVVDVEGCRCGGHALPIPQRGQVGKMQDMAVFLYRGWRAWNFFGSNFCSFLETQTVSEKQGGGIPKIFLG